MKKWTILWLSGLMGLAVGPHALSAESESTTAAAPYLLAGAPSFDQSISQFREKFNADNPKLPLNEFRSIATSRDRANLTRAASKINENLYASTALERGTLKIKSMQITAADPGRSKRRPDQSAGVYERHDPRLRADF